EAAPLARRIARRSLRNLAPFEGGKPLRARYHGPGYPRNGSVTELRTRDRERKLISKIDEALQRVENGSYGYCEETDEPIGVRRLDARPIATLSLEAQERHERLERTHRDD